MSQVLLIADRPQAVIQQGQPPAQMAAWLLDIPAGSDAFATAEAYVAQSPMPVGTVVRIVDLAALAGSAAYRVFELEANLAEQDVPGS